VNVDFTSGHRQDCIATLRMVAIGTLALTANGTIGDLFGVVIT
jgi:hypothetical protein